MATLILGAFGTAVGGPFGGMIGATLGAAIDNRFVFPKLFPPDPIEGQRLGDLPLTSAVEGTPMNYCLGPENHLPGVLIWQGPFIEFFVDIESGGGGCGGSEQKVVERKYYYLISLAIAVCEGEINNIKKIWADGKLLYNDDVNRQIVSNQISGTLDSMTKTYMGYNPVITYFIIWKSPTVTGPAPDLTIFQTGSQCTVSGAANPANNGSFNVVASWTDSVTGDTYLKLSKFGLPFVTESAGSTITISQVIPAYRYDRVQDITIYKGFAAQSPDSLMESYLGVGEVPAYQGVAYVVFKNLMLNEYGIRIPHFTFLVEQDASLSLEDGTAALMARSGLDVAYYDTSFLY